MSAALPCGRHGRGRRAAAVFLSEQMAPNPASPQPMASGPRCKGEKSVLAYFNNNIRLDDEKSPDWI